MKRPVQFLLMMIWIAPATAKVGDMALPPIHLRAAWDQLPELKLLDWTVGTFLGWDVPFDGGSKVFTYRTDTGEQFDIMLADPACWTPEDKEADRQVALVIEENRFCRVNQGSEMVRLLIEKLTDAPGQLDGTGGTDPRLVADLTARLASREPLFDPD